MTIHTKYSINEKVFVIYENKVIPINISGIRILVVGDSIAIRYISDIPTTNGGVVFLEDKVFKTKEELLKSL